MSWCKLLVISVGFATGHDNTGVVQVISGNVSVDWCDMDKELKRDPELDDPGDYFWGGNIDSVNKYIATHHCYWVKHWPTDKSGITQDNFVCSKE
jgi:hypothetical protein